MFKALNNLIKTLNNLKHFWYDFQWNIITLLLGAVKAQIFLSFIA